MEYLSGNFGRMIVVKLFPGEDLICAIRNLAEKEKIQSGIFFAIGTLSQAHFYFYAPKKTPVTLKEPLEIISCIGNISLKEKQPFIHAHISVSDSKYRCHAGPLLEGSLIDRVGEIFILELSGKTITRGSDGSWQLSQNAIRSPPST